MHYLILLVLTFPGTILWAIALTWTYRWCVMEQWSLPDVYHHQILGLMVMIQAIHVWIFPLKSKKEAISPPEMYETAITRLFVLPLLVLACSWVYSWLFL